MGYLNESGLARYDGLIKNWTTFKSGTVDGVDPLLNWQKTDTAGAVTFYPLPVAPIDPVVNFTFTETGPAEGTKGPDNPSTITGVSSITVTRCETVGVDGTDYTLPLGSTYYGGSVDLSAGTMTVTWHGLDLGTVSMRYSSSYEVFATTNIPAYVNTGEQDCSSETFTYNSSALLSLPDGTFKYQGGNFNFKASQYNEDVSAFQTAHSGEVLVYKLATPYTVQLSPVQILSLAQPDPYAPRLNTVYSDQQSVQVGYPKSPQATSIELTNAIVSLGGNV